MINITVFVLKVITFRLSCFCIVSETIDLLGHVSDDKNKIYCIGSFLSRFNKSIANYEIFVYDTVKILCLLYSESILSCIVISYNHFRFMTDVKLTMTRLKFYIYFTARQC